MWSEETEGIHEYSSDNEDADDYNGNVIITDDMDDDGLDTTISKKWHTFLVSYKLARLHNHIEEGSENKKQ